MFVTSAPIKSGKYFYLSNSKKYTFIPEETDLILRLYPIVFNGL